MSSLFFGICSKQVYGKYRFKFKFTANFTLNNTTSKVTLVLTGPSDRWFALGLGVASGFGMADGDVLLYTTSLTDRNYIGYGVPATDASQDWTVISNPAPIGGIRTLTLERALTNSDPNDQVIRQPSVVVSLSVWIILLSLLKKLNS